MVNGEPLETHVASVALRAPVMTASGTAGHGTELGAYGPLAELGAVVVKSLAAFEWPGNAGTRVHGVPGGSMLNSVGLQGPGVAAWRARDLGPLVSTGAPVVASIWGRSPEEYAQAATALRGAPGVVALEVNVSCPNLDGHLVARSPASTAEAVEAAGAARMACWAKLSPNVPDLVDIAAGGGCVGVHPALIHFAVYTLHATNLAIPWSNTAPGVECYYDLEKKPVDIINGTIKPTPPGVTIVPNLTSKGYPIVAGAPDDSAQAAEVLAQKPDAIIFSAQSSDCFNLLSALSNLGWSTKQIPLIFSGACSDLQSFQQAGAKADGVYVIGASYNLLDPTSATGLASQEISIIDSKDKQYQPSQNPTGLEGAMFQTVMTAWLTLDNSPGAAQLTPASVLSDLHNTTNVHMFAGIPWGCTSAPSPYTSVCSTAVSVQQWNGTGFTNVGSNFSAAYLIAGAPIKSTASSYGG